MVHYHNILTPMSDDVMTQLILSHKKGAVQRRLYFCGYCEWFQNRSHYWDIDWIWAIWFPNKRIRRVLRWSFKGGLSEHLAGRTGDAQEPRVARSSCWCQSDRLGLRDYPRAAYYLIISRDGDLQQQSSEPWPGGAGTRLPRTVVKSKQMNLKYF